MGEAAVTLARAPLLLLRAALSLLALAAVAVLAFNLVAGGDLGRSDMWAGLFAPERLAAALIVVLAVALGILIRGLRWTVLMGEAAPLAPARMVAGFGWSFLVLQALPFRAGEAHRVGWVKLRGGSAVRTVSSVVVERVLDALVLMAVLAVAALAYPGLDASLNRASAMLVAAAGLGLLAVTLMAGPLKAFAGRQLPPGRMGRALQAALDGLTILGEPRRGLAVAALTLAAWALPAAAFSVFLGGWLGVPWPVALAVLALTNLASFVTLAPGNIGVFEAVGVLVLAAAGVPAEAALAPVVALHLALLSGQVLTGLSCRLALLAGEGR